MIKILRCLISAWKCGVSLIMDLDTLRCESHNGFRYIEVYGTHHLKSFRLRSFSLLGYD